MIRYFIPITMLCYMAKRILQLLLRIIISWLCVNQERKSTVEHEPFQSGSVGQRESERVKSWERFAIRKILHCWDWKWRGPHGNGHGQPVGTDSHLLLTAKEERRTSVSQSQIMNLLIIWISWEINSFTEPQPRLHLDFSPRRLSREPSHAITRVLTHRTV